MSFDHQKLRTTYSNSQRELSAKYQVNDPYILQNLTPSVVTVLYSSYKDQDCYPKPLTTIQPFSIQKVPPTSLSEGDTLFVSTKSSSGNIPLMETYTVREFWKHIRIGAITYGSLSGRNEVMASNWDMRGVMIRNRLTVPLNVHYKGRLVAQMYGYSGIEYMGGGGSSLYFDNDREGLNMFDEIYFSYTIDGKTYPYTKAVLNDVQTREIFVGVISGGFWGPTNDSGVYKVDDPVYTGIVRFEQTAEQYRTRAV